MVNIIIVLYAGETAIMHDRAGTETVSLEGMVYLIKCTGIEVLTSLRLS